ncbi:DUF554 domain-containing protein [Oceanispirochaeta sp.]|jgi:uncharacterized membrane protein YqgA involved in biofilm formation|uniref:DUF554 domain-containing protein n=1 Tax=Oceanispirochaeta sp. TaxID=2035350 RepID=UPI00261A679A|nr:DUF554 domain-containing protein [Oceanispirochaeta sp.]MDA3958423.1 DUF554 domain-containing protein [Oceanispirochaeta sp.]
MIATVINAIAVLIGSMIGLVLKGKIHDKYEQTVFTALGIFTFVLGITMAQESCNVLYMVFSLVLGGLLGTWIGVEDLVLRFGEWMKSKLPVSIGEGPFALGFLDASVLFCVGALTIVGSFKAGIDKDYQLLLLKSVMDGSVAVLLAAVMGVGVAFSAVSILVVQGLLTIGSTYVAPYVEQPMIDAVSAVGGLLVIMIGINLLQLKKIKTANFMPALFMIILFQLADPWLVRFTG